MPDVLELYDYWQKNPPVHILLRVFSGYGKQQKPTLTEVEERAVAEYGGYSPTAVQQLPPAVQVAMLRTQKGNA